MLNRPLNSPGLETLPTSQYSGAFPRFGGNVVSTAASQLTHDLGPITHAAHNMYQLLAGDPGRRIIFMDLVGWCGLRTVIDYNRELFYFKNSANGEDKPKGNIPAAVERVLREVTATLSDVAVAGPLVAHLTHVNDNLNKQFTGNFSDQKYMAYISQTAKKLAQEIGNEKPLDAEQLLSALYQKIAQDLGKGHSTDVKLQLNQWFSPANVKRYMKPETNAAIIGLKKVFGGTKTQFDIMEAENQLAHLLGKVGDHSIDVGNQGSLTTLLSNTHKLQDKITRYFTKEGISWNTLAKKLDSSLAVREKLPLILGGIFLLNLIMPHLIQRNTQKAFGLSTYPGEAGLIQPEEANAASINYAAHPDHKHRVFPFLTQSIKQGNLWPLLGVALMVPAAVGIYRSGRLFSGKGLNLSEGFALPKGLDAKSLREYGTQWLKAHDFETSFPWAGEQQQATTYANTLVARIATARSPIEFRERLVDSLLSYTAAFEMNSIIDKKIARFLTEGKGFLGKQAQKLMGVKKTDLFKPNGDIRSLNEVYSMANPKLRRDTLTVKTWQGWAATLFTTLTMGAFEPILAIFLTSKQADWMNANSNRKHFEKTSLAYGNTRLDEHGQAFNVFSGLK